jgi:hypothetical protein
MQLPLSAVTLAAAIALAACQPGSSFYTQPFNFEFPLEQGYQAAYARVLNATRACYSGGSIIVSTARVEGQLYPDLGYGEVYHGESAVVPVHYSLVRIERDGSRSRARVRFPGSWSASDAARFRGWIEHWARDGRGCMRIGAPNAPPAPG